MIHYTQSRFSTLSTCFLSTNACSVKIKKLSYFFSGKLKAFLFFFKIKIPLSNTLRYYSLLTSKEMLTYATRMNLEDILLTEINQPPTDKCCTIPLNVK